MTTQRRHRPDPPHFRRHTKRTHRRVSTRRRKTRSVSPPVAWTVGRRDPRAPDTVRLALWNCQSVFPTHYGEWDRPTPALKQSVAHNEGRYAHHVRWLRPFLARLLATDDAADRLDAVCLQEVDTALVRRLQATLKDAYPDVVVHPPELADQPYHQRGDQAYHLLTLVHKARARPYRWPKGRFQRFATTPLDTCVVLNAHVSWVDTITAETTPERAANLRDKQRKNTTIVEAMRRTVEGFARRRSSRSSPARPVVVCGDLNVSSPQNLAVYERVFRTAHRFTQLCPVGASYNLKPENIEGVTTFQTLGKPPDDAVLCDGRWHIEASFEPLDRKTLPVDAHGYVDPDVPGRWPSDHALVEVVLRWEGAK